MTDTWVTDPLVGTLVDGRYRVRDRVARGGMATVYTAVDERLERTVALKMIHPAQATDPQFVERFVDEAKAIARLTHPNVVAAYDQGTHDGLPYLVMEYVAGRTLRDVLGARRRLTPVEALAITEQMLSAIAAAHRAGLVHRDVKPENVLVAEAPSGGVTNLVDSVVKVADFGLAQAVAASATSTRVATAAGGGPELLATVAYVAPELVENGYADPRGDVYSVGIVLFEMLTGRVPFDGARPAAVARQHVEQDVPPPSTFASAVPPALDHLVGRATRRDPAERPTDAGALLAEVQAVREEVTTVAARPLPAWSPAGDAGETVVMSAVAGSARPAWARLPAAKPGDRRPFSTVVAATGYQGQPTNVQRQRVVIAALVGVLALLLATGGWWFGFGRWEPAPDLVGMAKADAIAEARELGLGVTFAEPGFSQTVPAEHVLAQEPADRITRGGTLTLTLSRGPEINPVPDVIGAEFEVAKTQLESLGLVVVEGERDHSSSVPEGRVMALNPEVGVEVAPGDEITVTISNGRPPIDIPTVIGKPVDQATAELQAAQLTVATEAVDSNDPAGQVVGQEPGAGTGAEPGDTVTLQVSKGPPTRPVPDLTGQECKDAVKALEAEGFRVVLGFGTGDGRVALQNPSPGTGLPPDSPVTIWCR
jgi:beta-lactam-binding protein with PASTA domain